MNVGGDCVCVFIWLAMLNFSAPPPPPPLPLLQWQHEGSLAITEGDASVYGAATQSRGQTLPGHLRP